jgi:hypothetical protein
MPRRRSTGLFLFAIVPAARALCVHVPPLTTGVHLKLGTLEYDEGGVGGRVWAAASTMCDFLSAASDDFRDCRVVELGSGSGVCGLFAASLGAADCTLTDGGPPALLELLSANVESNRQRVADAASAATAVEGAGALDVLPLRWGEPRASDSSIPVVSGSSADELAARGVDWVIGSYASATRSSCWALLRVTRAQCRRAPYALSVDALRSLTRVRPLYVCSWQRPHVRRRLSLRVVCHAAHSARFSLRRCCDHRRRRIDRAHAPRHGARAAGRPVRGAQRRAHGCAARSGWAHGGRAPPHVWLSQVELMSSKQTPFSRYGRFRPT